MGHILWWLWLISIHIEHSASESRRVQRRMSAARLPTLYSLNRLERHHNLTPPHGGKVNGRAGTCLPIRFNELCKRSMHSFTSCDCLAAKYAESTRVWHSRFWGILWKKTNKKTKAFERRAIDFGINEKSSCMKCHCENELFSAGICVEFGKAFKRTCKTDLKFC